MKSAMFVGLSRARAHDIVGAMLIRTSIRTAFLIAATLSVATVLPACSGNKTDPKTADHIQAGDMPEGGEWQGVYYNQLYGFLHITESGGAVQGAWRTTAGDKWGELYGETKGNMLRYSWKEHKVGVVGPNATTEGKGYFLYKIPNADEAHLIEGEWGLGDYEVGHTWSGLKQVNMDPDPKSVRPDELESQVGADSWDGQKGDPSLAPSGGEQGEEKPAEEE